jgi:TolB protein
MLVRALISLLLVGISANASAQRLKIVVGGPNFRPYPIAATEVVALDKDPTVPDVAKKLTQSLRWHVGMIRSLSLVAPRTYLVAKSESWTAPHYGNWINVGASGLVRGAVHRDKNGYQVTFRFYDVVSQEELFHRSYVENRANVTRAVWRFLDELVELLTGEKGILSSKIASIKTTRQGKSVALCDLDGSNEQELTDPAVLSLLPAWDPTGKQILFTSYLKNNPDLFRMTLSSRELEWLSNKRGLNTGGAVSPDGKQIALTLSIDGNTEIYVMQANGKNLRRLTDSWGQDVSPSWSPDGSRIAFVSSRSGNPHIYVMGADGSNPKRLTFQGNYNQEPNWSPRADGQIAFTARDEFLKYDIFAVHPDTGLITRLTQDEGNNESPSHSPDGHHVVFTSSRTGRKAIYIMDVDGLNQRRVSKGSSSYETPAWSPRLGY